MIWRMTVLSRLGLDRMCCRSPRTSALRLLLRSLLARSIDPSTYAAAALARAKRITDLRRNPAFPAAKADDVPADKAADVAVVASEDPIVTLFLPSAASAARRELSLAALRNEFEVTFPTMKFEFVAHHPPMFEGVCDEVYFVPPTDYRPEAKIRKILKQELLAATTSVLREAAKLRAQLIVGDGQGAVVAAALVRPRVVEAGLCSRSVQSDE